MRNLSITPESFHIMISESVLSPEKPSIVLSWADNNG